MILYTLDINKQKKIYLISTIFTLVFGIIYELFSHGVISIYMIFAFIIPLLGYLLYLLIDKKIIKIKTNINSAILLECGIFTLTIGSIIAGVLEIFGTTNIKVYFYLFIGILLILFSIVVQLFQNE